MQNKNMLTIIVVILAGIFSILAVNYYQDHGNKPKSVIEKMGDDVSEAVEEVGDEIDDHTDAR